MNYDAFWLGWWEQTLSSALCKFLLLFPPILWVILSPALANFLTLIICWIIKETRDSLLVRLCPLWHSVLWTLTAFAGLLASPPPGVHQTLPRFPPLPVNSLQTLNRNYCRAQLICFLSFRDHFPSLPDVQCLENNALNIFCLYHSCIR